MTDSEFWGLTLRKFDLLVNRLNEHERQNDRRFAMITAAIYNVNRDPKKRRKPFTPDDFLKSDEKPSVEDLKTKAKFITKALGGNING